MKQTDETKTSQVLDTDNKKERGPIELHWQVKKRAM